MKLLAGEKALFCRALRDFPELMRLLIGNKEDGIVPEGITLESWGEGVSRRLDGDYNSKNLF